MIQPSQHLYFTFHLLAQRQVQLLDFIQIPLKRRDSVSDVEHSLRELVSSCLIDRQRCIAPSDNGAREQLGVTQRVADTVRGERVLEEPRVPHECPASARRVLQVAGLSGETPQ